MLRRWLKEKFPQHEELAVNKHLSWLGVTIHEGNLWHLNRRSVSRGVAAGLVAAFIPLPIQMISAALMALLIRGNILIAIAATWVTNPITFVPLNYLVYKFGQKITGDVTEYHAVGDFEWRGKQLSDIGTVFLQWVQSLGKPFLIGLPIVAISTALIGYILVNLLWKVFIYWKWRSRPKPDQTLSK